MMRLSDIDVETDVWVYTPTQHKTQHHGKSRRIFLGTRVQEIIRPFLTRSVDSYLFSPQDSEEERRERNRQERVTPLSCGNRYGTNRKANPRVTPSERYNARSYRRAIYYACKRAFPPPPGTTGDDLKAWQREHSWSPNQLRHGYATQIRRDHGLEAAQVLLGHAQADVTQVYAERDESKAMDVVRRIG